MTKTIVNCTPHPVNIVGGETFYPFRIIPRIAVKMKVIGEINGLPLTKKSFGKVENLPEPEEGTIYIVSALVAQACPGRQDLIIPNTVKDESGKIIGCDGLSVV